MLNDVNSIKGSIHLLKFEQDNTFGGNSFEFALRNTLDEQVPIKMFLKYEFLQYF